MKRAIEVWPIERLIGMISGTTMAVVRSNPQFTIRRLLGIVCLLAAILAFSRWLVLPIFEAHRENDATRAAIERAGGMYSSDFFEERGLAAFPRASDKSLEKVMPILMSLGEDLTDVYLRGSRITDLAMSHIGVLKSVRRLDLANTGVTGNGLRHLRSMPSLERLYLEGSQYRGDCVQQLRSLTSLRMIRVDGLQAINIIRLANEIPQLSQISVVGRQIDDEYIHKLASDFERLAYVSEIDFVNTDVSEEMRRILSQKRPDITFELATWLPRTPDAEPKDQ